MNYLTSFILKIFYANTWIESIKLEAFFKNPQTISLYQNQPFDKNNPQSQNWQKRPLRKRTFYLKLKLCEAK
jgi:hypothetical protein